MSYAMTHLIIANEFAKIRNITNKELFFLACVAPDAVHAIKDFSLQMKANSHTLQPEEKWGQIYTDEAMLKWYHRLRDFYFDKQKKIKSEDDAIFLQGYALHILTDIFNCKLLYAKNLIKYNFKVDLMREEYRRECILQDNYLYQNYSAKDDIMKYLKSACVHHRVSDEILMNLELNKYLSSQNIIDNVSFLMDELKKAPTASIDHLEMLSKESTDEFLKFVLAETDRLLYDFPNNIF